MALIKYGTGIVQASGSIAGHVHARNRFGNYIRPRTKPVNPNSADQAAVRLALSFLTELWHSKLTAQQRVAWNTYAAAISMKNRLGEAVNLTGFNHFLRSNIELKRHTLTVVEDGPTDLALPEKDPTFAVTGSQTDQELSVTFDNTLGWANEAEGHLMVYMGVPQLVTRNFFNGPWRYAGKVDGKAATPPTSPAELDPSFTLVEGQRVFTYARIVRADGRLSEVFYASPFAVGA
jgi:hypothetical protein